MVFRSPVATVVVVASLALGIGANTAVFSFVNAKDGGAVAGSPRGRRIRAALVVSQLALALLLLAGAGLLIKLVDPLVVLRSE